MQRWEIRKHEVVDEEEWEERKKRKENGGTAVE